MSDAIDAAAAQWFAAQDGSDMDWDAFTVWLEEDPRHRVAFDRLALIDDAFQTHRVAIATALDADAAPDVVVPARHWWRLPALSGGLAAALVAAFLFTSQTRQADIVWQTDRQAKTIAFADDARAVLAPHSQLVARAGDPTRLSLVGAAYFDVAHRPDRTLTIAAGDYEVRDIGTRFEIDSTPAATRVAVAEGQLSLARGEGKPIALVAGRSLVARGGRVMLSANPIENVASWRYGTLVYSHAPLALVAADIARYSGTRVVVDPVLADQPFSGVLTIGDGAGLTHALAAIPDVAIRRDANGVHLERPRRR